MQRGGTGLATQRRPYIYVAPLFQWSQPALSDGLDARWWSLAANVPVLDS